VAVWGLSDYGRCAFGSGATPRFSRHVQRDYSPRACGVAGAGLSWLRKMPDPAMVPTMPQPPRNPMPVDAAAPAPGGRPWVLRLLRVVQREPVLFVTLGYLFISFTGTWANYWYYDVFGVPVLQYMQASDFIVAGLRDPRHLLILFAVLLASWLSTWPDLVRKYDHARAERLRRRWWGRMLMFNSRWTRWPGVSPESGLVLGFLGLAVLALYAHVQGQAADVRGGGGRAVRVTLAGAPSPLAGDIRLLGTSSAFVFLWWPRERRAEVVPIDSVGRIATAPAPAETAARAAAARAEPVRGRRLP
jgi:hypothetical protein